MMVAGANPESFTADMLFKPKKQLDKYIPLYDQETVFFSSYNPDMIMKKMIESLEKDGVKNIKESADKYKIKFEKSGCDEQNNNEDGEVQMVAVNMVMRISQVDSETVAIEF